MISSPDPRDQALAALLAAREGTGVHLAAAAAAHVRARPELSLADATAWAGQSGADARLVALEVLAALARTPGGAVDAGSVRAALTVAAVRAAADPDPDLRWAAAKALAGAGAPAVAPLVALAADPDADVRWQAVSSLPLVAGSPPEHAVLAALATATTDAEDDVADQAVFALGLQLEADTPALRDALAAHLRDGATGRPDTAAQAALALALRGDGRAAPAVRAALAAALEDEQAADDLDEEWEQAAEQLGDDDVTRLLVSLRARRARTS